jgi:protein-serine/threonine kinase
LLGNGSFGIVYSAKHKLTGKVYALKILNKKKLISKKQLKYAVG